MTRKQIENHRWFSSEILFVSSADMIRCVNKIRDLAGPNKRLDVHPAETGVNLDGYFTLDEDTLDQIKGIIKEYTSFSMKEYSIKYVLIEKEGFFSGWCEKYNRNGVIIEGVNLSDFFEIGATYTGSAKGDPNATE